MEKHSGLKFTFIGILVVLWLLFLYLAGINLGLDLQGGFELVYRLDVKEGEKDISGLVDETIAVIQKRIDTVGLKEIRVQSSGSDQIIVDLPGGDEAEKEQVKAIVERMGVLWFSLIAEKTTSDDFSPFVFPEEEIGKVKEQEALIARENRERLARGEEELIPEKMVVPFVQRNEEGEEIRRFETIIETADRVSGSLLDPRGTLPTMDNLGRPAVGFEFRSEGATKFAHLTREDNINRYLAIVLDGMVQSAPVIRSTIPGRGIIEGNFNHEEVNQQIVILKSGSLPTKPVLDREFSVGPMLGERSIQRGIIAIIICLAAVLVIMGVYYLSAGLVANLALVVNMILILGSLAASEATFTLPGLAGLVLTIGMAVDANILIFERIREEKAKGKSLRQAMETGFARAFWTIFDANVTTLLTAVILLWAGTGPIKGFAVTLSIGILCSMFTALFVTRTFLGFLIGRRVISEMRMLQVLKSPSMRFVKARHVAFAISMLAIAGGLFVFFSRGDEKYGIDFTGGSLFEISLRQPEPITDVKETAYKVKGLENAEVVATYLGLPGEDRSRGRSVSYTIRTRTVEAGETVEETGRGRELQEVLHKRIIEAFEGRLAPLGVDTSEEVKEEQDRHANILGQEEETPGQDENGQKKEEDKEKQAETAEKTEDKQGEETKKGSAVAYFFVNKTDKPEKLAADAAKALNDNGFYGAKVTVAEKKEENLDRFVRLRVQTEKNYDFLVTSLNKVLKDIKDVLQDTDGIELSEPFPRVDAIGASVAYNLKSKAVVAITLALIAIVLYIALRFELKFGFAAVFALGHDVAIALGVVTLVDMLGLVEMKINLPTIAAFLTIIGYSLNDTIVVFDRIRENLRRRDFDAKKSKESYAEIVNDSINETLSRTLLTSFTTFVVVLVLFLSGVEAIAGFTFAMLIGVVVGTYSSIFIASPILIFMRPAEQKKQ